MVRGGDFIHSLVMMGTCLLRCILEGAYGIGIILQKVFCASDLQLAHQMGRQRSAPVGYFSTWVMLAHLINSGALSSRSGPHWTAIIISMVALACANNLAFLLMRWLYIPLLCVLAS
jgi:hypothetical protein